MTLDITRFDLAAGWRFRQNRLFDPPLGILAGDAAEWMQPWLERSTPFQQDTRNLPDSEMHQLATVPAAELLEALLSWPMHEEDRVTFDQLLLGLSFYADKQGHLDTHVVFMDNLRERTRRRDAADRNLPERNWRIQNLHAGRNANYVGDQFMRTNDAVTVQIHNIRPSDGTTAPTPRSPVFAVALAWPTGFERSIVLQA